MFFGLGPTHLFGQAPATQGPSVLYFICPSAPPPPADGAVLSILNNGLTAAITRQGGTAFSGTRRGATGCTEFSEVAEALQRQLRDRPNQPTFVLLDSESLRNLANSQGNLLSGLGLRVMNLRLFTRPLHIFESPSASVRNSQQPNVGVYADQEIAPRALTALLQKLLGKSGAVVVPFENVAEMARCLAISGQQSAGRTQCPAEIGWAVIVEQDASLVLNVFNDAYKAAARTAPTLFTTDNLQLGVQLGTSRPLQPGIDLVVSRSEAVPAIPNSAPPELIGTLTPLVPRSEDKELIQQEARSTEPATRWNSFWAWVGSFGLVSAASDDVSGPLRHPYPIVLTNQNPPDTRLRAALSDSYLRVLGDSAMGTPCTAVAERIHRAYLFNAQLDDPTSEIKKLSLASELVTATGDVRNLTDLFARLNVSPNLSQWQDKLGPAPTDKKACPSMPNERFPDDRLFFSNPQLAFQYRAMEHLRRGNLDGAAMCLRLAVASRAVPDCHTPERSTYSFYYNPYFYFAVQQVNSGQPAR